MSKHTVTDTIIAGLKALGYKEQPSSSRKYRQFVREVHEGEAVHRAFVGKAGALRCGRNVTESVSMERTDARRRILAAGQRALGLLPPRVALSDAEQNGIAEEAQARGAR